MHVEEICESIKLCLNSPSPSIESLGHGNGYSVKQIIEIFKKVNKVNFEVIYCDQRPCIWNLLCWIMFLNIWCPNIVLKKC